MVEDTSATYSPEDKKLVDEIKRKVRLRWTESIMVAKEGRIVGHEETLDGLIDEENFVGVSVVIIKK